MRRVMYTPWVREHLAANPDEAMQVEALRLTAAVEGSLRLSGKSWRGPWLAIVNTERSGFNGYRGEGTTVLSALERAVAVATEREAAA